MAGYAWIDLPRSFAALDIERQSWTFRNDGHWNELGNKLAAVELFDYVTQRMGVEATASVDLERESCVYYSAFHDGWLPSSCIDARARASETEIRQRYTSLEYR